MESDPLVINRRLRCVDERLRGIDGNNGGGIGMLQDGRRQCTGPAADVDPGQIRFLRQPTDEPLGDMPAPSADVAFVRATVPPVVGGRANLLFVHRSMWMAAAARAQAA